MSEGRYRTEGPLIRLPFCLVQRTYRDSIFPLRNCEVPVKWVASAFWRPHENIENANSHWGGWCLWEAASCCPTQCGRPLHLEVSPGTSQPHKSESKKGGRRAAEQRGVRPCLLVHPRVTALHFPFIWRRLLAFISHKANFVCNYSFSLHTW